MWTRRCTTGWRLAAARRAAAGRRGRPGPARTARNASEGPVASASISWGRSPKPDFSPAWRCATRSFSRISRSGSRPRGRSRRRSNSAAGSSPRARTPFSNSPNTTKTRSSFSTSATISNSAERIMAPAQFSPRRASRNSMSRPTGRPIGWPTADPRPAAANAAAPAGGNAQDGRTATGGPKRLSRRQRLALRPAATTASGARGSRSVTTSTTTGSSAASACCSAGAMVLRLLDPDAAHAKAPRHFGEVGRAEADQLLAAPGPVARDAAHAGQVLAEAGIVVDDDRRRRCRSAAPSRARPGGSRTRRRR